MVSDDDDDKVSPNRSKWRFDLPVNPLTRFYNTLTNSQLNPSGSDRLLLDRLISPSSPSRLSRRTRWASSTMRPLTESETKALFSKLANYLGPNLVHLVDTPDDVRSDAALSPLRLSPGLHSDARRLERLWATEHRVHGSWEELRGRETRGEAVLSSKRG